MKGNRIIVIMLMVLGNFQGLQSSDNAKSKRQTHQKKSFINKRNKANTGSSWWNPTSWDWKRVGATAAKYTGLNALWNTREFKHARAMRGYSPLVRLRANVNLIQEEYYNNDLRKAVDGLSIALAKFMAQEEKELKRQNQTLIPYYGMKRYEELKNFVATLNELILGTDKNLALLLKEENKNRRMYETENNIKGEVSQREKSSSSNPSAVIFDYEGSDEEQEIQQRSEEKKESRGQKRKRGDEEEETDLEEFEALEKTKNMPVAPKRVMSLSPIHSV